ncbi:helix-turn-helix domain-containing protein [Carnobacterium mobile]|uniref:helix-turn-helix domain-containing protein n=1 Tax=Carnobacterium mobile TaxID=2750 RepID=UPI0005566DB7|nr:helix-turn-helix domain-containing protein [Carnobacterium mobile]
MNFNEIKAIYPDAQLIDKPKDTADIISFPFKNKWVQVEKITKTPAELDLLRLLFSAQKNKPHTNTTHSEWQAFLLEEGELPSSEKQGDYRIIQFAILKKDQHFEQKTWLKAFKSMFENCEEAFFIDETTGLLIQNSTVEQLTTDELSGIIQTLDDDFSIKTFCYIGQFWPLDPEFKAIFKEEQLIFNRQKNKGLSLLSLPSVALHYYISDALEKSPLMQNLKQKYTSQTETKELILALWHSQGNISLAAKSLYVHRNTLQYRIDRFYEVSGLSLRNMNDLLLCYLLVF